MFLLIAFDVSHSIEVSIAESHRGWANSASSPPLQGSVAHVPAAGEQFWG